MFLWNAYNFFFLILIKYLQVFHEKCYRIIRQLTSNSTWLDFCLLIYVKLINWISENIYQKYFAYKSWWTCVMNRLKWKKKENQIVGFESNNFKYFAINAKLNSFALNDSQSILILLFFLSSCIVTNNDSLCREHTYT